MLQRKADRVTRSRLRGHSEKVTHGTLIGNTQKTTVPASQMTAERVRMSRVNYKAVEARCQVHTDTVLAFVSCSHTQVGATVSGCSRASSMLASKGRRGPPPRGQAGGDRLERRRCQE